VTLKAKRPVSPAYPKFLITLGDHLRKRRLDLSLRQKDVSQRLGVSEASIWYWEKNLASPSFGKIPKIIKFLGYVPYDSTGKTFEQQITIARRVLGLSQKELANFLGVDSGTVRRWEKGRGRPKGKLLVKLSSYLEERRSS
jgi:transcriptional regulator with XRE-family HTH domain